jgi:hypothetical protein
MTPAYQNINVSTQYMDAGKLIGITVGDKAGAGGWVPGWVGGRARCCDVVSSRAGMCILQRDRG